MGLDMYAYATRETPDGATDFYIRGFSELHYWRKHPNLHGWMEELYRDKGGCADSFNCVNVALDLEDLDRLESDIRSNALPDTSGFFFGKSDGSEAEDDLAFVATAREAILSGACVYYTSWW